MPKTHDTNTLLEQMFSLSEKSIEGAVQINEINLHALQEAGQRHTKAATSIATLLTENCSTLTGVRDPEAAIGLHTQFGKELSAAVTDYWKDMRDVGRDLVDGYGNVAEGLIKHASGSVSA